MALRSGAHLRCGERALFAELTTADGTAYRSEPGSADGNFGGCELVVSPDERFAALFFYSGQGEVGYELYALTGGLHHLGGLPYVQGLSGLPVFSPDSRWVMLAVQNLNPRVRGTGEYAETVLEPGAEGEVLVDWATLYVQRLPEHGVPAPVLSFAVGTNMPANTDVDEMLEWNTYDALSFRETRLVFRSSSGAKAESDIPPRGALTLA